GWSADPFKVLGLNGARAFRDEAGVLSALDHDGIGLQEVIELRERNGDGDGVRGTTPGRVVFNHEPREGLAAVPPADELAERPFREQNRVFTKRELSDFIEQLVNLYGPTAVSMALDSFKNLGFRYASASGLTISKNDIVVPPNKDDIISRYDVQVDEIEEYF